MNCKPYALTARALPQLVKLLSLHQMYFPKIANQALITWFWCGRIPFAPGTAGSIGAVPLCWVLAEHTSAWFRFVFAIGFTCIAILGAAQDQAQGGTRDPGYIVVDEVAGMLWSTILIPATWSSMLVAFVLFRIFDILKPFPARFFDRRSKSSPSAFRRGAHIVLDDVFAAFYVLLILYVLSVYSKLLTMH